MLKVRLWLKISCDQIQRSWNRQSGNEWWLVLWHFACCNVFLSSSILLDMRLFGGVHLKTVQSTFLESIIFHTYPNVGLSSLSAVEVKIVINLLKNLELIYWHKLLSRGDRLLIRRTCILSVALDIEPNRQTNLQIFVPLVCCNGIRFRCGIRTLTQSCFIPLSPPKSCPVAVWSDTMSQISTFPPLLILTILTTLPPQGDQWQHFFHHHRLHPSPDHY